MAYITNIKLAPSCPLIHSDTILTMKGCCRICVAQLSDLCAKCPTLKQINAGEEPTFPKKVALMSEVEFDKLASGHIITPYHQRRRRPNFKPPFKYKATKVKYPFAVMEIGEACTCPSSDTGKIRSALTNLRAKSTRSFTTKTEGPTLIVRRIA